MEGEEKGGRRRVTRIQNGGEKGRKQKGSKRDLVRDSK